MSDLIELRESSDPPDSNIPIYEQFSPLCERAVRKDGTLGIKIIAPGWGSSGYYGREVLERDIPRVFPPGTHMFWNHPTYSEEAERPEGDLNALAAITVSPPVYLENGPKGPGMYADARPFAGYAETIDEIGEHIGVSIRALGRHTIGEAEGKDGRIIQELVSGKSIDYVTVPGAGGAITTVFESAPGATKLPKPTVQAFLTEAGRVLSKANETKLRSALEQLTAVLTLLDSGEVEATEATGELESDMSEKELKEAQTALSEAQTRIQEQDSAIAKMQEQLLLREARDFVTGKLAEVTDLPDVTKARLSKSLISNPPIKEGKIDESVYQTAVDAAVTEAKAEIAALTGSDGRITGMGGDISVNGNGQINIEEARKRQDAALVTMGYGSVNDGN